MIEKVILAIITSVLQFMMSRYDQRNAAKAEVYRDLWERARKAYEWERGAVGADDGGATLRVRDGASTIKLQGDNSATDRSATPPSV